MGLLLGKSASGEKLRVMDWTETMEGELDDATKQVDAIEILTKIGKKGPKQLRMIAEARSCPIIVESMNLHKDNELVLRAACLALALFASDPEMSEHIREAKGRETLEACIKHNSWDTFIQVDGRKALDTLFHTGSEVGCKKAEEALKEKDLQALMLVSDQHPLKDRVQMEAMANLSKIVRARKEVAEEIANSGFIVSVIECLKNHVRNPRVIMSTCALTTQLALVSQKCSSLLGKGGACELLITAVQEFSGWAKREYEIKLKESVTKEKLARAEAARRKKYKVEEKGEDQAAQKITKRLFTKNLPCVQFALHSIGNLMLLSFNKQRFIELDFNRLLTYLIDVFHTDNVSLVIPLQMRRVYQAYQERIREKLRLEKLGLEIEKTEDEKKSWEDKVKRRKQNYKPCTYSQTLGKGMCYRHCIECFAINGVCKHHAEDNVDHIGKSSPLFFLYTTIVADFV